MPVGPNRATWSSTTTKLKFVSLHTRLIYRIRNCNFGAAKSSIERSIQPAYANHQAMSLCGESSPQSVNFGSNGKLQGRLEHFPHTSATHMTASQDLEMLARGRTTKGTSQRHRCNKARKRNDDIQKHNSQPASIVTIRRKS